jgi:hypothetical protein
LLWLRFDTLKKLFFDLYLLVAIFPLPETKGRSLEEIEKELFEGRIEARANPQFIV